MLLLEVTHLLNSRDRNCTHYTVRPLGRVLLSWGNLAPRFYWALQRVGLGDSVTWWLGGLHIRICCWQLSASTSFSSQPFLNGVCNPPSHLLSSLPGAGMLAPALCHLSESIFLSLAYMDKKAHCHVTPRLLKTAAAPTPNLGLKQCPPLKETWRALDHTVLGIVSRKHLQKPLSLAVLAGTARRWAHLWITSLFLKSSRPWITWRNNSSVPSA